MKIVFVIIFVLGFELNWAHAGGDSVRNGGDALAQDFTSTALLAVSRLSQAKLDPENAKIVSVLKENISSVHVHSTNDSLILNDTIVDAVNTPADKAILFNRIRWIEVRAKSNSNATALALHEYLGVSGFDDQAYEISLRLISLEANETEDRDARFVGLESTDQWYNGLSQELDRLKSSPEQSRSLFCTYANELYINVNLIYWKNELSRDIVMANQLVPELPAEVRAVNDKCDADKLASPFSNEDIDSLESSLLDILNAMKTLSGFGILFTE